MQPRPLIGGREEQFIAGARVESDISRTLVVSDEAQGLRWAFFAEKAAASSSSSNRSRVKISGKSSSSSSSSSSIPSQNHKEKQSVGVVGSGLMGSGIAASALLGGLAVVLCDVQVSLSLRFKGLFLYIVS